MNLNRRILARAFSLLFLLMLCACDNVHKKLAELNFAEGMKKYNAGNIAGASNDFSGAIEQDTNFMYAYSYRGSIRLDGGNYDLALQDFDRAVALKPGDARLYSERAAALLGLQRFPEAAADCTKAIQLDPTEDYAYKCRASIRASLRDWDGALEDFNEAEKLNANDPWVYGTRARLQADRREYERAIDDATKAIELERTNPMPYTIRGFARQRLRDFEGAAADLNEANRLLPRDPGILACRGLISLEQDHLKEAEEDMLTAAKLSPTNYTVMLGLASLKNKSGDVAGAAAELMKAVEIYTNWPDFFVLLGTYQSDMSQFPPALKSFRKAVEIDPKLYYAEFAIWVIRARDGEREEATKDLRASLKPLEGDERQKWQLCIGQFLLGDVTESNLFAHATATAVRATDVPSQKCEALYFAGMKRLIDGDKIGAAGLFEKCVALGQDNDMQYFSAKAELKKLQKP
jgi:tetratricopeptide (TPR) repeat protein